MIHGKVTGQVLQLAKNTTVSDIKNYISARFVFSLDWLDLTKTVHFRNGENQADVTLVDDGITQDRGIDLSAGTWDVWLHGAAYNESTGELEERITTTTAKLVVLPYQTTTGEPFKGNNASAVEIEVGKAVVAATQSKASAEASEASRIAAEKAKKDVDDTVETFDNHVTEKTTEATQAITEHTETEKTNATDAISSAKDAGVAAVNSEIEKKGQETLASIPEDYTALAGQVSDLSEKLGKGRLSFTVNAEDGGLDITYTP